MGRGAGQGRGALMDNEISDKADIYGIPRRPAHGLDLQDYYYNHCYPEIGIFKTIPCPLAPLPRSPLKDYPNLVPADPGRRVVRLTAVAAGRPSIPGGALVPSASSTWPTLLFPSFSCAGAGPRRSPPTSPRMTGDLTCVDDTSSNTTTDEADEQLIQRALDFAKAEHEKVRA